MLNHIASSINARIIQPWQTKHFELTKAGKKLKQYKDIHRGQSCFLIGNGPSLRAEDLTIIHEAGIPSFGFNRVFYIFDQTLWRPTYYISQDEKILAGCVEQVNSLSLPHKFIPINHRWYLNINIQDAEEFLLSGVKDGEFWFADNIAHSVCWANTVMYTAAQFAVYMGFQKLYLLGVDHHYHISRDKNGKIIIDDSVKDYFSEKYNKDRDSLYIPSTDISTETFYAMKKHCDERKIEVYNATRGGKLEVFPRLDFDSVMKIYNQGTR